MKSCAFTRAAAVAALVGTLSVAAQAADPVTEWPSRPIRLLVGYPAGGSVDSAARALSTALSAKVGQQVIVENRVGADGVIAITAAMRAPADGYTLAVSVKGAMTVAPVISKLPFEPATDLAPIAPISQTAELFVTRRKTGITHFSGLAEGHRRNGGKLSIGYVGAFPRMLSELLAQETKLEILRVPYRGLPAAMQDLLGDQIDLLVGDAIGVLVEQIHAGNLIALAVTSAKRQPNLPQVPTTTELGVPALTGTQWYALFGPKELAPALVAKIHAAVTEAMKPPAVVEQLSRYGMEPFSGSPADLSNLMRLETQFWRGVAAQANIKPE